MPLPSEFVGSNPDAYSRWLRPFWERARYYSDNNANAIVLMPPSVNDGKKTLRNEVFYSVDGGKTFHQLKQNGTSRLLKGSERKFVYDLEDPFSQNRYTMLGEGNILTFIHEMNEGYISVDDFKQFMADQKPGDYPKFIPLPEYIPDLLFCADDGYFYVEVDRETGRDYRAYMGFPERMEQVHLVSFLFAKDGGSVIIHTDRGILFSPTHESDDLHTSWIPRAGVEDFDEEDLARGLYPEAVDATRMKYWEELDLIKSFNLVELETA